VTQESSALTRAYELEQRGSAELDGLAARAGHGDRVAFEQIYTLLVDDLYGYVRGLCRDDTAAEDVTAEVFFKAWRSAPRYRPGSNTYRRWLFTIARNEVRDYWRSRQATIPIDGDFQDAAHQDPPPSGDALESLVERGLGSLTESQRQVVVLRYYRNKSFEEIASLMGKREGAVRAQLMRALNRMRKVVGDAAT